MNKQMIMQKNRQLKTPITGQCKSLSILLICLLFSCLQLASAQESPSPLESAQQALQAFLEDWNKGDLSAIVEHLNFPHVTHAPRRLIIANSGDEFNQDFDALRREGWRRSSFDKFTPLQVSADKVNFLVNFRRYNDEDEVLSAAQVFYVVTLQDGKWGMQYRSGGPHAEEFESGQLNAIEQEARAAVDRFFVAFNDADAEALFAVNHVPQAVLNGLNFIHAEDRSSPLINTDFDRLRRVENWHHSISKNVEAVHVMPGKVVFELQFERFNNSGQSYREVSALWVLTKTNEKWGVQFRSLMQAGN